MVLGRCQQQVSNKHVFIKTPEHVGLVYELGNAKRVGTFVGTSAAREQSESLQTLQTPPREQNVYDVLVSGSVNYEALVCAEITESKILAVALSCSNFPVPTWYRGGTRDRSEEFLP